MFNILSIDFDWINHSYQWIELNQLILDKINKNTKFCFIKQHHHIMGLLQPETHVVNIDQHHDLGYMDEWNHSINAGNWVNFGINSGFIKGYDWVCNSNSHYNDDDGRLKVTSKLDFFNYNLGLKKLTNKEFDLMVFVESFGYRLELKNEIQLQYFIPWDITKQFIEKCYPERIIELDIKNVSKWIEDV